MNTFENNLSKYGVVSTGLANNFYSDRLFNPNNMVCPNPLDRDTVGRDAAMDTVTTKTAGCNSALDRVEIEVQQRPTFTGSRNLSSYGIQGGDCVEDVHAKTKLMHYYSSNKNNMNAIDPLGQYNSAIRKQQWENMICRSRYYKYLSGCL